MLKNTRTGNLKSGKCVDSFHSDNIDTLSNTQLLNEIDRLFETSTDKDLDVGRIEACLTKLQERTPVMEDYDPNQAWEKFQTDHPLLFESEDAQNHPGKTTKHSTHAFSFLRIAVIAAVMLFAFVVSASALGFKPMTKIVEWGKETFVLRVTSSGQLKLPESETTKYRSLREAVESDGYDASFCPTWIPKDYSASAINRIVSDKSILYYVEYLSERGNLLMTAHLLTAPTSDIPFEKDDSVIEYPYEDTTFYIYTNTGTLCAVWQCGDFLCTLDGNVTEEELYRIIHSIF